MGYFWKKSHDLKVTRFHFNQNKIAHKVEQFLLNLNKFLLKKNKISLKLEQLHTNPNRIFLLKVNNLHMRWNKFTQVGTTSLKPEQNISLFIVHFQDKYSVLVFVKLFHFV